MIHSSSTGPASFCHTFFNKDNLCSFSGGIDCGMASSDASTEDKDIRIYLLMSVIFYGIRPVRGGWIALHVSMPSCHMNLSSINDLFVIHNSILLIFRLLEEKKLRKDLFYRIKYKLLVGVMSNAFG
jgi:hypothetical protein